MINPENIFMRGGDDEGDGEPFIPPDPTIGPDEEEPVPIKEPVRYDPADPKFHPVQPFIIEKSRPTIQPRPW